MRFYNWASEQSCHSQRTNERANSLLLSSQAGSRFVRTNSSSCSPQQPRAFLDMSEMNLISVGGGQWNAKRFSCARPERKVAAPPFSHLHTDQRAAGSGRQILHEERRSNDRPALPIQLVANRALSPPTQQRPLKNTNRPRVTNSCARRIHRSWSRSWS